MPKTELVILYYKVPCSTNEGFCSTTRSHQTVSFFMELKGQLSPLSKNLYQPKVCSLLFIAVRFSAVLFSVEQKTSLLS